LKRCYEGRNYKYRKAFLNKLKNTSFSKLRAYTYIVRTVSQTVAHRNPNKEYFSAAYLWL
jgi:hypothetical protein